jgi:hypothetical protein
VRPANGERETGSLPVSAGHDVTGLREAARISTGD